MSAQTAEDVEIARSELETARAQAMDIISPKNFETAEKAVKDAEKEAGKKNPDTGKIDSKLSEYKGAIGLAYAVRVQARDIFKTTIEARFDALLANAPQYAEKDWKSAEEEIKKTAKEFEAGKQDKAQQHAEKAYDYYREADHLDRVEHHERGTDGAGRRDEQEGGQVGAADAEEG